MNAEQLLQEAKEQEAKLTECRRYLHSQPETGFDLAGTVAFVKEQLTAMGYAPQDCGKAGVVVLAGGKKPGKVFLIRGDMDALPIREEADVEFASDNGKMHACGHDMHTAMMLGAAKLLKEHEDEIEGTVKLMFQPAEEIFEGAQDMIEAGVLQSPDVDAAMMLHVIAGTPFPPGTVLIPSAGEVSASGADFFEIKVQGKGCHGSMPNNGVDPITVAAHIVIALQEIHARELGVGDQAVLTVGTIHAGAAANVIPDGAVLGGSIRTYDEEMRSFLKERLREIAQSVAATFRATATVTFGSGCPSLVNDAELTGCVERYTKELLGRGKAFSSAELKAMATAGKQRRPRNSASEDFAYVCQRIPGLMLAVAAGQPDQGYAYPQHHPKAKFDESLLATGSAVYVYNAMRWLEEHRE